MRFHTDRANEASRAHMATGINLNFYYAARVHIRDNEEKDGRMMNVKVPRKEEKSGLAQWSLGLSGKGGACEHRGHESLNLLKHLRIFLGQSLSIEL